MTLTVDAAVWSASGGPPPETHPDAIAPAAWQLRLAAAWLLEHCGDDVRDTIATLSSTSPAPAIADLQSIADGLDALLLSHTDHLYPDVYGAVHGQIAGARALLGSAT